MASVVIQNQPQYLTPLDFRAAVDAGGGLAKSARFITRILPTGSRLAGLRGVPATLRDLVYMCEVVDMPGRGFNSNPDITYYGPSITLPFQTVYNELDVTILCRTNSLEREFFDDWMNIINPNNSYDFNYRDEYRSDIDIFQFAEAPVSSSSTVVSKDPGAGVAIPRNASQEDFVAGGNINATAPEAKYNITVHDAWPIQVHPQPMSWNDDGFQRLVVTFTYHKWSRKGLDPRIQGSGPRGGAFSLVTGRQTGGF